VKKKCVIGLGDSILLQANPDLFQCLARQGVTYSGTNHGLDLAPLDQNVGPSTMLLTYMKAIESQNVYADVLIMACGLHDIKHVDGEDMPMVSIEVFRKNLDRVFVRVRTIAREGIWVLMPPVFDHHHNRRLDHKRYDRERIAYNHAVIDAARRHDILVIDSKDVLGAFDERCLIDHVHLDLRHTKRYAKGICLKIKDQLIKH
jgi:hypothetical protein